MSDNWADTSTFRCETCMFFVKKGAAPDGSQVGRCRRHAPTLGGYPVVFITDFCGDHKLAVQSAPGGAR